MADGRQTDGENATRRLRDKYNELAAKYGSLVERGHHQWGYRIALQTAMRGISNARNALAIAQNGHIIFRNQAFLELERRTRWVNEAERRGTPLPLGAWAIRSIDEMKPGARVRVLRLHDSAGRTVVALRFERQMKPPGILIWAEDITTTELRENELSRVRQSLIHQHRLLMLGEAAAAVAHDLGSTLRALAYRATALRHDEKVSREHGETLHALDEGLQMATATVQRLHDFARSGVPQMQSVDVKAVLRHAVALFQLELDATQSNLQIRVSVPDLPPLRASSADLSHLFLNLLRNASDAMAEGGEIRISAKVNRKVVILTFEDEGAGIPKHLAHRLFEPFFTTKGSQGTGLGLWLAASTMRRMGGTIQAAPRRRRGTRFTLTFPRRVTPPPPRWNGGRSTLTSGDLRTRLERQEPP